MHRPPTAKEKRKKEEWEELCRKAGFAEPSVHEHGQEEEGPKGSFSSGEKGSKEEGQGSADNADQSSHQGAGTRTFGIVFGKITTVGDVVRAGAAAKEKQER